MITGRPSARARYEYCHWVGGTANDVDSGGTGGYNWSHYGLRRLADSAGNGTVFVAPQGINNGWANSNGRDVTFVDNMLSQLEGGLCVDTAQVFSAGFSYGGAMTYALACARPTVLRAVAVYSGCRAGYPVVRAAFEGAGHDPGPIDGSTGDGWHTWTSGLVWNFFTQFDSSHPPTTPPTTPPASGSQEIVGQQSGRCVDINSSSTTNGTQTQLWTATAAPTRSGPTLRASNSWSTATSAWTPQAREPVMAPRR